VTLATIFLRRANFIDALYIVAFSLFIYGMSGLTGPRTAVRGNKIAATGMAIAVIATLLTPHVLSGSSTPWLIALGLVLGTAIGIPAALNVKMTAIPQMVALFNGVGGGAVAIIAWVEYRHHFAPGFYPERTEIPSLFAAIVGSISFWGSNIAFGKLQELIPGRPIKLRGAGQAILNTGLLVIAVASAIILAAGTHSQALFILGVLVCAAVLGNAIVLPIGGADMPVVISLLNAFTGLSAAATGIALNNTAMIVAGMIVGASGTILTNLMAKAMNRSVPAIVAGGFGGEVAAPTAGAIDRGPVRATSAQDVAILLSYARLVVIAPGYGMAVAQAQHAVRELEKALEAKGVEVRFAIHPVAGRMPGHMNVLLAEADVPYDMLKEMDDINPEFPRTDVTLVIGANDVTNPAAKNDPGSPIYGMPILEVDESHQVIVLKRSMASGFAGIDNPLFYEEKTQMLFGDAKQSVSEITAEVQAL
jgi:proton-translocating NAD(P)+ transhydrogenase subunit beta